MLPKAIFFDLDDTIVSYDGAADLAWQRTCSSFVGEMSTPFDLDTLMESINKVRRWYWGDPVRHRKGRLNMQKARREIVRLALEKLQYFDEANACKLADDYNSMQEELVCLFPDSLRTLEKLHSMGVRMALITNGTSELQRRKIQRFNLSRYFELMLIEGEAGFGKPDVRVYQRALEELRLEPHEVWMVGDNLVWDIEAPQKLGIYSIWNDFKKRGLPCDSKIKPDRIIHSIAELIP